MSETFDSEVRDYFFEAAERHGVGLDEMIETLITALLTGIISMHHGNKDLAMEDLSQRINNQLLNYP